MPPTTTQLVVELSLNAAKFTAGLAAAGLSRGAGGLASAVGLQGGLSGIGSPSSIAGSALGGQLGLGSALSFVSQYGLTSLGQVPGLGGISGLARDAGHTFTGTMNASQDYMSINERFNRSGIGLSEDVNRSLARRALSQQSFVQSQAKAAGDIFLDETKKHPIEVSGVGKTSGTDGDLTQLGKDFAGAVSAFREAVRDLMAYAGHSGNLTGVK